MALIIGCGYVQNMCLRCVSDLPVYMFNLFWCLVKPVYINRLFTFGERELDKELLPNRLGNFICQKHELAQ